MTDNRAHTLFNAWAYMSANPHATVRELCRAMNWQSPSTAHRALNALEKLGYITKPSKKHGARKIIVTATYLDQAVA